MTTKTTCKRLPWGTRISIGSARVFSPLALTQTFFPFLHFWFLLAALRFVVVVVVVWLLWSSSSSSLASWRPSLPLLAPGRRSFSVGRRLRRRRRRFPLPPPGSWSVGRSPSLLQNLKPHSSSTPSSTSIVVVVVVMVCHRCRYVVNFVSKSFSHSAVARRRRRCRRRRPVVVVVVIVLLAVSSLDVFPKILDYPRVTAPIYVR